MTAIVIRDWAKTQFGKYRGAVAWVATSDAKGDHHCGTAFHVGEGVFVTARHVVEDTEVLEIGFDDNAASQHLVKRPEHWGPKTHGAVSLLEGPLFHSDEQVDVACFRVEPFPETWIPLGGHLDDFLGRHELVLFQTLVLGYPPIPFTTEPRLLASVGEVNALVELRDHRHPHFIISSMARGGFSGGPVLIAYNEENPEGGTAALGLVTESLNRDGNAPEQGFFAVLTIEPIFDCLERNNLMPKCQHYDAKPDS